MLGLPSRAGANRSWERATWEGRELRSFPGTVRRGEAGDCVVPGRIGERFEVESFLSFGEWTALLLARDRVTGSEVVVKGIRPEAYFEDAEREGGGPGAVEAAVRRLRHQLQTERRLLVRLRNAGWNTVPVPLGYVFDLSPGLARSGSGLDAFLMSSEPYLILQKLTGVTLEAWIDRDGAIEPEPALAMLLPVVRTLHSLATPWRGPAGRTWHCVYQDLKLANLMLDPLGRLSLFDFGGCQVVVDGIPVLEGGYTQGYAPPECEAPGPTRVLLPSADVFTVGSTLLHMLSGVDPRARHRINERTPSVNHQSLPASCPRGVRSLLERCLDPRPSGRFAHAGELAEAMGQLLDARTEGSDR